MVVIQPLSTRLIKPNFCFDLSHRRSTTVSLETRNSFKIQRETGVFIWASCSFKRGSVGELDKICATIYICICSFTTNSFGRLLYKVYVKEKKQNVLHASMMGTFSGKLLAERFQVTFLPLQLLSLQIKQLTMWQLFFHCYHF